MKKKIKKKKKWNKQKKKISRSRRKEIARKENSTNTFKLLWEISVGKTRQ